VAELGNGAATVIIGELGGASSPARRDTDHLGVELDLRAGRTVVPLRADFEYALVVLDGEVDVDGHAVTPGHLAYMGLGRDEGPLSVAERATALLIGGVPFPEPILMWWNYVARTRDEVGAAHRDWSARSERFGTVASELEPIDVGPPPWEAPLKP
jgi:redox-sensitive bicupin YhaK (pirin superfamily)